MSIASRYPIIEWGYSFGKLILSKQRWVGTSCFGVFGRTLGDSRRRYNLTLSGAVKGKIPARNGRQVRRVGSLTHLNFFGNYVTKQSTVLTMSLRDGFVWKSANAPYNDCTKQVKSCPMQNNIRSATRWTTVLNNHSKCRNYGSPKQLNT